MVWYMCGQLETAVLKVTTVTVMDTHRVFILCL